MFTIFQFVHYTVIVPEFALFVFFKIFDDLNLSELIGVCIC